jgi:hypothetical protein
MKEASTDGRLRREMCSLVKHRKPRLLCIIIAPAGVASLYPFHENRIQSDSALGLYALTNSATVIAM